MNTKKACVKCGIVRVITRFYKHKMMADGHLNVCKPCFLKQCRERYEKKREERRLYEKERFKRPERKAKILLYQRNRRERFPGKCRARQAVNNAVRDGRMKKLPCQECGDPKSQAHHHDYRKKLEVTWMCFKCHREKAHGQIVGRVL